jgi:hypothetical protein
LNSTGPFEPSLMAIAINNSIGSRVAPPNSTQQISSTRFHGGTPVKSAAGVGTADLRCVINFVGVNNLSLPYSRGRKCGTTWPSDLRHTVFLSSSRKRRKSCGEIRRIPPIEQPIFALARSVARATRADRWEIKSR